MVQFRVVDDDLSGSLELDAIAAIGGERGDTFLGAARLRLRIASCTRTVRVATCTVQYELYLYCTYQRTEYGILYEYLVYTVPYSYCTSTGYCTY